MASQDALQTLDNIVSDFMLGYKKPTEDAVIYLKHTVNCVRDLSLYHSNEVVTAKVAIDANYIMEMPDDMIGFVDLCWYFNGEWWSFTERKQIVNTTTFTGLVEGRDSAFQEGQPISHALSDTYGGRGGVNNYNYTIDWKARRIFVDGVSDDTAVLFYTSSGVTLAGTTYINSLYIPVIEAYLLWKETYWVNGLARERAARERDYTNEVLKVRNFVNSLNYNQLRDIILSGTTQGVRR